MDVFAVWEQLVSDYSAFTSSFVEPRDSRIQRLLSERESDERQWPQPWLSLNPNFAPGGSVDDLVAESLLHPTSGKAFRVKESPNDTGLNAPIRFHRHQREAIEAARTGKSYVLTTGTGSGKSVSDINLEQLLDGWPDLWSLARQALRRTRGVTPDEPEPEPTVEAGVVLPEPLIDGVDPLATHAPGFGAL